MFLRYALPLIAGLALSVSAATVDVNGTVQKPGSYPFPGVSVRLAVLGLETVTDSEGNWAIKGNLVGVGSRASSLTNSVSWTGRSVFLELAQASEVRVDAYDLRGSWRGCQILGNMERGSHEVALTIPGVSWKPSVLRVTMNGRTWVVAHEGAAGRMLAVPDTVIFSWMGKVRIRYPISSPTYGTIWNITIDTSEIGWSSSFTYGSLVDVRDGHSYRTVRIGSGTWMAENLDFAAPGSQWYGATPGDNEDHEWKYGRLYSWSQTLALPDSCDTVACASIVGARRRGICPEGWHVSNTAEWDSLVALVGGAAKGGLCLKSEGGWAGDGFGSGGGTDCVGFRGLPGGYAFPQDPGKVEMYGGTWWLSNEHYGNMAKFRGLMYSDSAVASDSEDKSMFHSVRCVKD